LTLLLWPVAVALLVIGCHPTDERQQSRPSPAATKAEAAKLSRQAPAAPEAKPPSETPGPQNGVLATFTRTACLGTCPSHSLTIHDDGTVLYKGAGFVKVIGQRTKQLTREELETIVAAFEGLG